MDAEAEVKARAKDVAQEMTAPFCKQINSTPALLSLLYDIDLLPEQIVLPVNAARMIAVCKIFEVLTPEQIDKLFCEAPVE